MSDERVVARSDFADGIPRVSERYVAERLGLVRARDVRRRICKVLDPTTLESAPAERAPGARGFVATELWLTAPQVAAVLRGRR